METADFTGTIVENKYLLRRRLGEGGMGAVYEAEHTAMGKKVAVKILHPLFKDNEEIVKRFFREARAAAAIAHRNIIDVLDMGVLPSGEPFLVMEFLYGIPLDSLLSRKRILDLPTAVAILDPALAAIGAAHGRGVVHRDLKPENIFLHQAPGGPLEVKLIDFGISKFQDAKATKLTEVGATLGTPAYMSPEQVRGAQELDHRTDLYAVGVILYEMLAGDTPFEGEQYNQLLINILMSEPRHPSALNPAFPEKAWPFIQKAIAKDPDQRFASAQDMRTALLALCTEAERHAALTQLEAEFARLTAPETTAPADPESQTAPGERTPAARRILTELVTEQTAVLPATEQGADAVDATKPREQAPPAAPQAAQRALVLWNNGRAAVTRWARSGTAMAAHWLRRGATALRSGPHRVRNRAIAGAGAAALVALLAAWCSGPAETVTITVIGAPRNATIAFDGRRVPPKFTAEKDDDPAELTIGVKGRERMRVTIVPIADQKVFYSRFRAARVVQTTPNESHPAAAARQTAATEKSQTTTKRAKKNSTRKKAKATEAQQPEKSSSTTRKSRNPFRQLRNELRKTFKKDTK